MDLHIYPASAARAALLAAREWPERLTDIESWHEHIPFAFALMALMRPERFVELGTHRGDSFCAFCQAALRYRTGSRCFAVDSWQGDPQAGEYGDDILAELRDYVTPRYGEMATLLPMFFDDALAEFADGSIDLLHIDGLHTAEAVRHDFETWLPKLSRRGVVLFHDTAVTQAGFGVGAVWEALRQRYPGFAFEHGNGLGVLLTGPDALPELREWCEAPAEAQAGLRAVFAALGERVRLSRHLALHRRQHDELWKRIGLAEDNVAGLTDIVASLRGNVAGLENDITGLEAHLAAARQRAASAEAELEKVLSSRAWRMTAPLRHLMTLAGRGR